MGWVRVTVGTRLVVVMMDEGECCFVQLLSTSLLLVEDERGQHGTIARTVDQRYNRPRKVTGALVHTYTFV